MNKGSEAILEEGRLQPSSRRPRRRGFQGCEAQLTGEAPLSHGQAEQRDRRGCPRVSAAVRPRRAALPFPPQGRTVTARALRRKRDL